MNSKQPKSRAILFILSNFQQMENEILANEKIQELSRESTSLKILNTMLNSCSGTDYKDSYRQNML